MTFKSKGNPFLKVNPLVDLFQRHLILAILPNFPKSINLGGTKIEFLLIFTILHEITQILYELAKTCKFVLWNSLRVSNAEIKYPEYPKVANR